MAVSMRWKLLAVSAAFTTLAFGACGEDKDNGGGNVADAGNGNGNGNGNDAGTSGRDGGGLTGLVDIAQLDDNVAGKACTTDAECGGTNASCANLGDEGALSTCTGACETDAHCGAGGTCIRPVAAAPGACAKVCDNDTECGDERLECRRGIDVNSIIDQISQFFDAGAGSAEETPNTCLVKIETANLADGIVGTACTDSSTCGGGTCRTTSFGVSYPDGYCTGECLESSSCGNTGGCGRGQIAVTFGSPGSCFLKCTAPSDCRTGYDCQEVAQLLGPGTYCVPIVETPDGGVGTDAGASDAGASDAGASDAGAGDAAEPDAAE